MGFDHRPRRPEGRVPGASLRDLALRPPARRLGRGGGRRAAPSSPAARLPPPEAGAGGGAARASPRRRSGPAGACGRGPPDGGPRAARLTSVSRPMPLRVAEAPALGRGAHATRGHAPLGRRGRRPSTNPGTTHPCPPAPGAGARPPSCARAAAGRFRACTPVRWRPRAPSAAPVGRCAPPLPPLGARGRPGPSPPARGGNGREDPAPSTAQVRHRRSGALGAPGPRGGAHGRPPPGTRGAAPGALKARDRPPEAATDGPSSPAFPWRRRPPGPRRRMRRRESTPGEQASGGVAA